MAKATILEHGRASFDRCVWSDAYEGLSAADREAALAPEDLERLAIAAYLTGRDHESGEAWTRAHRAFLDRGDTEPAARCAFWLGFESMQRAEVARAGGWFSRAQRLLGAEDDCAVDGYLLVPSALQQLGEGDHAAALATFGRVAEIAERFHDEDLQALGRLGQGQVFLRAGDATKGCMLFDEVMVSVTAGEVSAVVSGIVYCAVVDECQQAFDVRRAREWTAALSEWCDAQPGLVPYRGQCMVHRSQILQLDGDWSAAVDEARRACDRLSDPPHPAIGMACYQLGEVHRVRGEFAEAEEAYRRATEAGRLPQPGLALLRLAQGRVDAASNAIAGALVEARDDVARAQMLPAYVEIMLVNDRVDEARRLCEQLVDVAAASDVLLLQAQAQHALGEVLIAEGDTQGALAVLRDASGHWRELSAPYHRARTALAIAYACRALGDDDTAELEMAAARTVFEELGARPDLDRLDAALDPQVVGGGGAARSGLTPREREVLAFVASGRTNRQIAGELVISEKTVARHISNIFGKIGVSSRSAATAYAYEHGLV